MSSDNTTNNNNTIKTYEGAVVIITGGASGIGRAIAEVLATKKVHAIILLDRQAKEAEEFATSLHKLYETTTVKAYEVDVRDYNAFERVVKETKTTFGRIDYLFNNAGVCIMEPIEKMGVENFDYVIDVNIKGVSNGIHAAYPIMKDQGFGHIVNTSSIAGLAPTAEGGSAYATSKFAVVGLSKDLRIEAARHGVRVSALCPGFVRTPILQGGGRYGKFDERIPQEDLDKFIETYHPMDPKDFADQALKFVAKNKPIIVVPRNCQIGCGLCLDRLFPTFSLFLTRKLNDKMAKDLEKLLEERKKEGTEST